MRLFIRNEFVMRKTLHPIVCCEMRNLVSAMLVVNRVSPDYEL